MNIEPIAYFRSPLTSKFGAPRQSGLAQSLTGQIVFQPEYRQEEALRGLDGYDYLWLIWEFSANSKAPKSLTVRPPRLGGNRRMGVFATRSPFRPNNLGLSCVAIECIDYDRTLGPIIRVSGADLIDGTPIYDIKPYVAYADAHPDARSGFADETVWRQLHVVIQDDVADTFSEKEAKALREILAQDPRPQYHNDPERIYGLSFAGREVKFRIDGDRCHVVSAM